MTSPTPLLPLERALLRRAQAAADAVRADAERQAGRLVEAAQRDAAAVLAQARTEGEADAARLLAEDHSRSRQAARAIVLAAQRDGYDELREQARTAVRDLLADPVQHRRLVASVQRQLGPQADVRDHPAGGVIGATPDGRRVDASVDVLVDQALARLDLQPLWEPPR